MSLYSERLNHLKKEINAIVKKKNGRLTTNQKIMHRFIFGKDEKAVFNIKGQVVELRKGDSKKGFVHIIEKHYNPNDIEAIDILNIIDVFKHGMRGISSTQGLDLYTRTKNQKQHNIVMKKTSNNSWVVTFFRKT